jgi:hypothetical protein
MKPNFERKLALSLVLALGAFLFWCCQALLEWNPHGDLMAHSYSIWGDWSAHLTFIESIKQRGLSWIAGDNPIFAEAPFQYPFLSHLITAWTSMLLQISSFSATRLWSLALITIAPWLVFRGYQRLGLSPLASALSVLIFFLMGGFQWWEAIGPNGINPSEPLTNQFDHASVFTQFVLFEFFPQRAFLFGLTLVTGLGATLLFWTENTDPSSSPHLQDWRQLARWMLGGIGLASLAWLHVHSFLAVGVFLMFYFVFSPSKRSFAFSAWVALLGAGALAFLLLRDRQPQFQLTWDLWLPGWVLNSKVNMKWLDDTNGIQFWIWNTGLFLPLVLSGGAIAIKKKSMNTTLRVCAASGAFLFLLANTLNIQPYWYDNLKTFTYAFFFLAPFTGIAIESLWLTRAMGAKRILLPALGLLILATQVYSGTHDLWLLKGGLQNATFFQAHEFGLAEQFQEIRTEPDALAVIQPRHNHWVTALSGTRVLMGYPGWLWSWGVQYGGREQENNEILLGAPRALELLSRYQVSYVILNTQDRVGSQPVALDFYRTRFTRVLNRDGWEIFSIKSALKPSP